MYKICFSAGERTGPCVSFTMFGFNNRILIMDAHKDVRGRIHLLQYVACHRSRLNRKDMDRTPIFVEKIFTFIVLFIQTETDML